MLNQHYDLVCSSFYGLEGAPLRWNGVTVMPGNQGTYGNEFVLGHANDHFGGDLRNGMVVTLMDVWVLAAPVFRQVNTVSWVPVDHQPVPDKVKAFLQQTSAVPLAMSKFGRDELVKAGLEPLYVPHAVDTDVYQPHDRTEARKAVGQPEDAFIVGMVAANKGNRKGFSLALQAFRIFWEDHRDAKLYLHTVVEPDQVPGEDILQLVKALGIPKDALMIPSQYAMKYDPFNDETMARVYSGLDVLVNPAHGEGFGVPVLEAAACGTPAVVTNFSAMPEVAGEWGWHVGCRDHWTYQNAWQAMADVEEIVEAFGRAYDEPTREREFRSDKVREHALQYDTAAVLKHHMLPALAQAEERFADRVPVESEVAA
jgi:glycosyltransferase involved in cell wall biosynthesis